MEYETGVLESGAFGCCAHRAEQVWLQRPVAREQTRTLQRPDGPLRSAGDLRSRSAPRCACRAPTRGPSGRRLPDDALRCRAWRSLLPGSSIRSIEPDRELHDLLGEWVRLR